MSGQMKEEDFWLSASELGRKIGRGEIDPLALTEGFLERIQNSPTGDRIFSQTTADRALAEAHAAQKRAQTGDRHGLLDGVPLSWKDLFDSAGTETAAGSKLLEGRVPAHDCALLRRATNSGLICLGKTHMSELAFSGLGLNPSTATPPNRHDPSLVPGGSSSGAAASIAFGLSPAAIGSDTGGSVRIPAAWNDLIGLKTTHDSLPMQGIVPLAPSFDTVGPLCRSVEDAAQILAILQAAPAPDLRHATLKGRKFLVLKNGLSECRDVPRAGFDSAIGRIMDAGAEIRHAHLDIVDDALELSGILFAPEAYGIWENTIEAAPDKMFAPILARFRSGNQFNAKDLAAARVHLQDIRAQFHRLTAEFDGILLPTAPILPPNAEKLLTDDAYYTTENLLALRNTRIGNLMGSCALTLPTGLPMTGIMLLAPPFAERKLLRIGAAIESALA